MNLRFNLVDQNEITTMPEKSPDRHWKTTDYKMSGQLKILESEQVKLLKTFDGDLADVKSHLAYKKTVSAEKAHQCFFKTYDELKENRQQQRLILKPKFFESFDDDTNSMLEEKSKVLGWVVDKVPALQYIEIFRSEFVDCRKDKLRAQKLVEAANPILNELSILKKWLKAGNLSDYEKPTLCNQLEQLIEKPDEFYSGWMRIIKPEDCTQALLISVQ